MKFMVVSRPKAERLNINYVKHAWISITDPGQADAALNITTECEGVLRLQFHDVTPGLGPDCGLSASLAGFIPMTDDQAREIIDFVDRMRDKVNMFCIHCEAGQCRSAGVAVALCLWLNNGDDSPITSNKFFKPNAHVKSLIMRQLWDKMEINDAGIVTYNKGENNEAND